MKKTQGFRREPPDGGVEFRVAEWLPVQPKRELNDSRIVSLAAQILQTCRGVGIVIDRVVESIEEICCKSHVDPLFDLEVLEGREVCIPATWTHDVGSRTEIVKVTDADIETAAAGQGHRQPIVIKAAIAVRSEWPDDSLAPILWNQSCEVSSRNVAR